jgi:hypothetical protein
VYVVARVNSQVKCAYMNDSALTGKKTIATDRELLLLLSD